MEASIASTEGEWHRRVQWSTLLVPITTRQSFWTTYPSAVAGQALGGDLQGLVPAGLAPAPLSLHQRGPDAVARVDETGPEPALDAQHAEARRVGRHIACHHRQPRVLPHPQGDPAAHAAIRA